MVGGAHVSSLAFSLIPCKLGKSPASLRPVSEAGQAELVTSIPRAAGACNVTPIVVRRWIAHGWLPSPPWTVPQLHEVRDPTDPDGRVCGRGGLTAQKRDGSKAATATSAAEHILTPREPMTGAELRGGYRSRCDNGSWMRSAWYASTPGAHPTHRAGN